MPVLVPEVDPELEPVDNGEVSEVCCRDADAIPDGLIPELVIVLESGPPG